METIPNACKRCWWHESGQCFNKEIAWVTKTETGQMGEKITSSFFEKCRKLQKLKDALGKVEKERETIKRDIQALNPNENVTCLKPLQPNENHNCSEHKELIAGSYELQHEDYANYRCRLCGKTWTGYE